MSNAYKCDRCGKLYERTYTLKIIVVEFCGGSEEVKDLCPECQTFLEKWLKEYKKEGSNK